MGQILPDGYGLSIPDGQFQTLPDGYAIVGMQTVFETRRARLMMLVEKHGSVAKLNRALGWDTTNARLYQIKNQSARKERDATYVMGDETAREIEQALGLAEGWMDTPPSYEELDPDPQVASLIAIARALKAGDRGAELAQLVRIGHTFVEPPAQQVNGKPQ